MLGSVDLQPKQVQLIGYDYDRRNLTEQDVAIAQAHPFNFELGIPSTKNFTADYAIISYMYRHRNKKDFLLDDVQAELGIEKGSYPLPQRAAHK